MSSGFASGRHPGKHRDLQVDQLRQKFVAKNITLQERLRKAEQAKEKQADQARNAKVQSAVSLGGTLLGALTGRKISSSTISRASTTIRGFSRSIEESKDVARAGDTVEAIQQQIADNDAEFQSRRGCLAGTHRSGQ